MGIVEKDFFYHYNAVLLNTVFFQNLAEKKGNIL